MSTIALDPGEVRARIFETVHRLVHEHGMTVEAAVEELHGVHRSTIYRWWRVVKDAPREQWAVLLRPAKLGRFTDTDRSRIWRSMRLLPEFGYSDLEMTAETSRRHIGNYVAELAKAGYLRQRKTSNELGRLVVVWSLVRNTGPRAPKPMRGGGVWDPNEQRRYGEVSHA